MKKVILLLAFLAVVFSAGCIQYGPYPDYEAYEKVFPPHAQGHAYSAFAFVTQYGISLPSAENLNLWYALHPKIKDIIYQWAEETETAIREPKVIHNHLEIRILGEFIDGNPPIVHTRARYELTEEEKVQFDDLYERIDEAASESGMKNIPVEFIYGAI